MKDEHAEALLAVLAGIEERLAEIASYIAPAEQRDAPNIERPLEAFGTFDWDSIDATVVKADDFGPALVEWRGKMFKRRSPENKFGAAIWFSRANGKNEDGSNHYDILIKFRPVADADPISRQAERELRKAPAPPPPATNGKPVDPPSGKPTRNWAETGQPARHPEDYERETLRKEMERRKATGPAPETPPQRFKRMARELGIDEAEAGEMLRYRAGDYEAAIADLEGIAFERDLPSATTDPAVQQALAKAEQKLAKSQPEPEAPKAGTNLSMHAPPRVKTPDPNWSMPLTQDAEPPAEAPFKDQGSAIQWACRTPHYQKAGRADVTHAVGSLTNLIRELGCHEKDTACWSQAWRDHVNGQNAGK